MYVLSGPSLIGNGEFHAEINENDPAFWFSVPFGFQKKLLALAFYFHLKPKPVRALKGG